MIVLMGGYTKANLSSSYNNAVAVWSFQKQVGNYSGSCIQMSDGSSHTNIGWLPPDENGVTWVDGFALYDAIQEGKTGVRTWYDQKGNVDLTQRSFSLVTNPITIDMSATPAGTPAIVFESPASGQNALHDNANSGVLTDFFDGGGMFSVVGAFDANASSASYIWSKGSGNLFRYHNSSVIRLIVDFSGTNATFHRSSLDNSADAWWNLLVAYDKSSSSNIPYWQVNDEEYAVGFVTTTPTGEFSTDSSQKFSIGNRGVGSAGCMSGYISEFAIWDRIL